MSKRLCIILVLLATTATASASQLGGNPEEERFFDFLGILFFVLLALFASVPEVFLTTFILGFSGISFGTTFRWLLMINVARLPLIYGPMLESYNSLGTRIAFFVLGISTQTGIIKLLSRFDRFQQDNFRKLKWLNSTLAALAGCIVSIFIFRLFIA